MNEKLTPTQIVDFVEHDPIDLPISDAALQVEVAERRDMILSAMADRALDIATDPASTQRDAGQATAIYSQIAEFHQPNNESMPTFESRVATAKQALAERYSKSEEDFELISWQNEDGETEHSVVYAALSGIDLGDPEKDYDEKRSFDSLMADDTHFIEINGERVDTRTLTEAGYRAFIKAAQEKGISPLPDSEALRDEENEGVWTATWLPGEEADGSDARCGDVNVGRARVIWVYRDGGGRAMRLRPAVMIKKD